MLKQIITISESMFRRAAPEELDNILLMISKVKMITEKQCSFNQYLEQFLIHYIEDSSKEMNL